jgi:hypothetical protein
MVFIITDSIKILNNNSKKDHYQEVNAKLNDLLPDTRTLAKVIEHYFLEKLNPLMLHQLFLISNYFQYVDEIGNRDMQNVIVQLLSETNLDRKSLRPKQNNVNMSFSGLKDNVRFDEDEDELDISNF